MARSIYDISVNENCQIEVLNYSTNETCVYEQVSKITPLSIVLNGVSGTLCVELRYVVSPQFASTVELANELSAQLSTCKSNVVITDDSGDDTTIQVELPQYKILVETILAKPTGASEKEPFECFQVWQDNNNGELCVTVAGDNPNDGGAIIDNFYNTYKMASNTLGALPSMKSELNTKKGAARDICGGAAGRTVTLADLAGFTAADIASLTAAIPPDAGYEWGLVGLQINQHPAKKTIYCDLADAQGTVSSNAQIEYAFNGDNGQFVTIGDSPDEIIKVLPSADECGCLPDQAALLVDADFTTPITLPAGTALEVCPIYVCVVSA